jgi:hypothetical protein
LPKGVKKIEMTVKEVPVNVPTPFVVFYGYHPEDKFSTQVGKRISSLNLPNIKAVRLHGIPNRRGQVVEQVDAEIKNYGEKMRDSFFIDLHTGEVDARIHPHQTKTIVGLGGQFLHFTGCLQGRFSPSDIDFYSTYGIGPPTITRVEFFSNSLSGIDEGVQLLLRLVNELSKLIR